MLEKIVCLIRRVIDEDLADGHKMRRFTSQHDVARVSTPLRVLGANF